MATIDSAIEHGSAPLKPRDAPREEGSPRRLLGRASVAGAGAVYQQCVAFLSGLVVARVLGAADYGVFNLARNLLDTATIGTRLGLDIGLQRHFGETKSADDSLRLRVLRRLRLIAACVALLPVAAVMLGLGDALEAHVYHHAGFAQALSCLALALPFVTDLGVLGGAYRGSLRPGPSVMAEYVLMPTARLLVIIALFLAGWRLWAVAAGTTMGSVVASAWLAWRARRDFPVAAASLNCWPAARRVIGYSSVLAVAVLVTTLTSSMDVLTLGRFGTAAQLGQYSLAKTLLLLIGFFSIAFNQTLGALVAEKYFRGDRAGLVRVLSQTTRWVALGTLPVFAIFLFWGTQLMLLFGPTFVVPPAVMALLGGGQFVLALFGSMGWALSMTNRHVLELGILVAGLLLSAVLCYLLVPAHGQLGAAVATFCSITFVNAARTLYARRVLRAFPYDSRLLLMVGGGVLLAFAARLLVGGLGLAPFWSCAAGIALFVSAYAAWCWFGVLRHDKGQGMRANAAG
ncbi:MAG TPA: oligosaccharide flippase family protein [Steroidobacteraceae bacterium]|nr:oligosaccharide flippase family protein [Steroidobacteraceae bacterium]